MTTINKVRKFHRAFRQPYNKAPGTGSIGIEEAYFIEEMATRFEGLAVILAEKAALHGSMPLRRMQLSVEELAKFYRSLLDKDLVKILNALTDRQYALDGDYLAFGFDQLKKAAFDKVHESNMTKLDNGNPVLHKSGKVMKGPNYKSPDLRDVFGELYT